MQLGVSRRDEYFFASCLIGRSSRVWLGAVTADVDGILSVAGDRSGSGRRRRVRGDV